MPEPAFDEERLNMFDEGRLSQDQIYMMLINAVKRLQARIEVLEDTVSKTS